MSELPTDRPGDGHLEAMRALLPLLLSLNACVTTVSPLPADGGGAAPDAPTALSDAPAALSDAPAATAACAWSYTAAPVRRARMLRLGNALVVAFTTSDGRTLRIQALTPDLREGDALSVTLPTGGATGLAMAARGDEVAVVAGEAMVGVAMGDAQNLLRRFAIEVPEGDLLDVVPSGRGGWMAVGRSGQVVFSQGDRWSDNTPNEALSPPHGAQLAIRVGNLGSGYDAEEPAPSPQASLLRREFIFGHGAALLIRTSPRAPASASRVMFDERAAQRLVRTAQGALALETRGFDPAASPTTSSLDPAVGARPWGAVRLRGDGALAAWQDERSPRVLVRFPLAAATRELLGPAAGTTEVLDVESDGGAQGWVLTRAAAPDGTSRLHLRCVARAE